MEYSEFRGPLRDIKRGSVRGGLFSALAQLAFSTEVFLYALSSASRRKGGHDGDQVS